MRSGPRKPGFYLAMAIFWLLIGIGAMSDLLVGQLSSTAKTLTAVFATVAAVLFFIQLFRVRRANRAP